MRKCLVFPIASPAKRGEAGQVVVNVGFMERGPSCEDAGVWAEIGEPDLGSPTLLQPGGPCLLCVACWVSGGASFGKGASQDGPRAHLRGPMAGPTGTPPGSAFSTKFLRPCPAHGGSRPPHSNTEREAPALGGWPGASPLREGPLPEAFLTLCPEPRGTGQNPEFLSQALPDRRHLPQVQRLSGAPVVRAQV